MTNWQDHLPTVRGRYLFGSRLADQTWFRVGGPADVIFRPADEADLADFLAHKPDDVPVAIVGAGSNLLVRQGGISGIVIRLGRGFNEIRVENDLVHVGAGSFDRTVALTCRNSGLGNLEFLVGIPGTIGGAVTMNAGAYGQETKDKIVYAHVLDPQGGRHRLTPDDLQMTYRHTNLPEGWIVTGAVLKGNRDKDVAQISANLDAILKQREATQPTRGRTGGSTFKNPLNQKAWELIDAAGCRGLKIGDAQVSEKHCNFLLNLDQATANDLELLAEEVKRRVQENSGVSLEWEIVRMGRSCP